MKKAVSIFVAVASSFATVCFVGCNRENTQGQAMQPDSAAQIEKLNSTLADVVNENNRLKLLAPTAGLSPAETLQRLALLNPGPVESRTRSIRLIIHHLETLVDAGTNAILPMRKFIASGANVDYAFDESRPGAPTFWNWHPGQPLVSGLVLPPTLRLGLVDVFRLIGGEAGETSLAWMMNTTTRGAEVYYIAQALEKIAPGKYTELATQAAKKLLQEQPTNASSTRLDAAADSYLYAWLDSRGDTSMVAAAEVKLVNAQGHLDVDAARYLIDSLKDQAMPTLAKIYNESNDGATQNQIANLSFNYVGDNPAADAIFGAWVLASGVYPNSQTINARPRAMALMLLAGGTYGPFSATVPTDPQVIANRISLLEGLLPQFSTPPLIQAANQSIQNLKSLLAGSKP